jgi:hypothetical protein
MTKDEVFHTRKRTTQLRRLSTCSLGGLTELIYSECHVTFCLIVTFLKIAESTQLPP